MPCCCNACCIICCCNCCCISCCWSNCCCNVGCGTIGCCICGFATCGAGSSPAAMLFQLVGPVCIGGAPAFIAGCDMAGTCGVVGMMPRDMLDCMGAPAVIPA